MLRPPPPTDVLNAVGSATREALRFPLAGPPLASLVTPGGSATVVIELPNLPVPSCAPDPREEAIAATVEELGRLGVANVTILVAGGLGRRPSPREIGLLVPPEFRRRFRGRLIVHDVEGEDLVELGTIAGRPVRISPALVETDLVVTVTAAESVLHGGPSALVRACSREVLRASGATSLLETSSSAGLGARRRARAAARRSRPGLRRLARPEPPARLRRLSLRRAKPRADRRLEAPPRDRRAADGVAPPDHRARPT